MLDNVPVSRRALQLFRIVFYRIYQEVRSYEEAGSEPDRDGCFHIYIHSYCGAWWCSNILDLRRLDLV